VKFINLTRHTEIGANSYYLEAAGQRLVLDSGMHPREEGAGALPNLQAIDGKELNAILVSHAHHDHIGTLPVLMRRHPAAHVFMTDGTNEIGTILLHNSVNVMTRQREELGATLYPLFTHRETDRATDRWQNCPTRQRFTLEGDRAGPVGEDSLTFEFIDAGHVLGSAGILLRAEGRTFFYTGDVNFDDQTIMQAAEFPEKGIDVLIMECTRGDHPMPVGWTRPGEEQRFAQAINEAFRRGGCILIPVFALGKTQEVLAMFHKFRREKLLDEFPIYIGGLSSKLTETYDRRSNMTRRQLARLQLLPDLEPFVLNGQNIRRESPRPGRIYALSSGMMTPKTLSNIFAQNILEDPRHSVFFVGYADPASPAGILRDAKSGEDVMLDSEEAPRKVRCHREQFQFSAHATRESLVDYAKRVSSKKIVLVHGDPPAIGWMRTTLSQALPRTEIIVPEPGNEIEL
jgi:Cft2 family RNA processing exonuclease